MYDFPFVDILYLLDRLEEVLAGGTRLPFNRTVVDEQECLDILDQIRVAVPEEIKSAQRVVRERDQMLEQAETEAARLLREADQRIAGQVSNHALVRAAEERAAEIEDEAQRLAEEVHRDADAYAYQLLKRLQKHLVQIEESVDQGLQELGASGVEEDLPEEPPTRRRNR